MSEGTPFFSDRMAAANPNLLSTEHITLPHKALFPWSFLVGAWASRQGLKSWNGLSEE